MKTFLTLLFCTLSFLASGAHAQNVLPPTLDRVFSIHAQPQPDGKSYMIEIMLVDPVLRGVLTKPRLVVEVAKEASVQFNDPVTGLSASITVNVSNVGGVMTAVAELRRAGQVLRSEKIVAGLSQES
jgi:hypothetical protein